VAKFAPYIAGVIPSGATLPECPFIQTKEEARFVVRFNVLAHEHARIF
jgi:hypothetical protein